MYENGPESLNIFSSSVKTLKDVGFSTSCVLRLDEANVLQVN